MRDHSRKPATNLTNLHESDREGIRVFILDRIHLMLLIADKKFRNDISAED